MIINDDIADSPLNISIFVSIQLGISAYILNTLGLTFKVGLNKMKLVFPYTKLLLSVSRNINLPIVTVIIVSTLLLLLLINCEKFIVTLRAYPGLNLLKIRYIFIQ